jgi:hypothetical protein
VVLLSAGCGKDAVAGSGSSVGGPASTAPGGQPGGGSGNAGSGNAGGGSGGNGGGGGGGQTGDTVDACALLTAAEVADALGSTVPGEAATGMDSGGECTWQYAPDPLKYKAITVTVAGRNTAAGDKLPDPELGDLGDPEPVSGLGDGARYLKLTGTVEFPAGDRLCGVQVVDLVTAGASKPTAIKLAGLVRGRF